MKTLRVFLKCVPQWVLQELRLSWLEVALLYVRLTTGYEYPASNTQRLEVKSERPSISNSCDSTGNSDKDHALCG